MVLYTVSVSASVVSIHFCGTEMEQVTLPSLEKKACCCTGAMAMKMDEDTMAVKKCDSKKGQKPQKTPTSKKSCCADIVLQSRLATDQPSTLKTRLVIGQPSLDALPAVGYHCIQHQFSNKLHQQVVAAFKAPPPKVPLYILFQRFTYYG